MIWLLCGGEDSTDNTVVLCPNCRARMHIIDSTEDRDKLKGLLDYRKNNIVERLTQIC